MSIILEILIVPLFALLFYSFIESRSFSPTLWRRGLVIFRHAVKKPITPDLSLIGHKVTFNGVVAKLIDERTCLFRDDALPGFRSPRQQISPLLGEIRFDPKGYLVLGRLPWSQVLVLLTVVFIAYTFWFGDFISWPLSFALALISVAAVFSFSVLADGKYLRKIYPQVIDWVQSRK